MNRKLLPVALTILTIFLFSNCALAQTDTVNIHLFWSKGCPHCAKEKIFLDELEKKYPELEVISYETTGDSRNIALLKKVGKVLSADTSGVPFTVIGDKYFIGYFNDSVTGKKIEAAALKALEEKPEDVVTKIITRETNKTAISHNSNKSEDQDQDSKVVPETVSLPLIGEIQTKNLSLPAFTFVVALLDGFNPCAMWVLLFLISLLLGMKNRKRMWILGITFIVTSAAVYFLFLSAWLNLFLFLGFIIWVRILIGLLALGAGGYYLRDYYINREGGCKAMESEKRRRVFDKLKEVTCKRQFLLAITGIAALAVAVNLIELICSAGLPAVYTNVLSLTPLAKWQYYFYLLFYIFIFMLDDLFVFLVAMFTLHAVGVNSKYARYSHLAGGIIMLLIGLAMLFKPELLMFG